jgi:hypothetical protein
MTARHTDFAPTAAWYTQRNLNENNEHLWDLAFDFDLLHSCGELGRSKLG